MGRYGPRYRTAAGVPSAVKSPWPCFETVQAEFRAPSFLRLLRLFAAKPGPARLRCGEELLPRIARRGGGPVPRTYFCRDIAAAEVGRALTQRLIQAFSKDPDLTHF